MKRPIKVLHFTSLLANASFFNNLWDFTDREEVNHIFATFTGEGEFSRQLEKRGAAVHKLAVTKTETVNWSDLPKAYKPLVKLIEDENIDIVHPHLLFPGLLGIRAARRRQKKSVLTRHHSDALHVLDGKLKRKLYSSVENYINSRAGHIIAPSRMVRDILIDRENVPPEKVSLIPYGQSFERFAEITPEVIAKKRAELGMEGKLALVCVSRLFERKGQIYLLEALAPLLRDGLQAKLYLLGAGDYRPVLEAKAKELGIEDSVEFLGFREDILSIIGAADIIAHPSLEDALSQALIESLMLGKPIVATDIAGAADTLDGGKYGKLVKPADAAKFRDALRDTIENLDAAREKAAGGRKYLLEYMDGRRVAEQYAGIYRKLLT
jgi:glycosyltransferase involved in cell wall biosynthesis